MHRMSGILAVLALVAALAVPSAASASEWYWDGFATGTQTAGVFGARHTLTGNAGQFNSCLNAMNETGTSWVTNTVCGYLPQINFCGCALRYPWLGWSEPLTMRGYSAW